VVLIKRVSIVLAEYCPHCVPFSIKNATKMAEDLGVPLRVLNIEDPQQESMADKFVEKFGDWSEDYLIPQVFIEYEDGEVEHILTGFSEAVSVTEAAWENFFLSSFYKDLVHEKGQKPFKRFVEKYLNFKGQCRRHCKKSTLFVELLHNLDCFIGAYVCPDGYVSRVIYFSINPDIKWFRKFLDSQVGEEMVKSRDVRPATRHGWELEKEASAEINKLTPKGIIKEIYWTTYPKTEEEKRLGVFLCSSVEGERECRRLFVQDIKAKNKVCPKCQLSKGK
jgi:hypothetical protein